MFPVAPLTPLETLEWLIGLLAGFSGFSPPFACFRLLRLLCFFQAKSLLRSLRFQTYPDRRVHDLCMVDVTTPSLLRDSVSRRAGCCPSLVLHEVCGPTPPRPVNSPLSLSFGQVVRLQSRDGHGERLPDEDGHGRPVSSSPEPFGPEAPKISNPKRP